MIEETAIVVDIDGEFAWVETQRKTTCGACSANKGCGTATIGKIVGNKRSRLKVLNNLNAKKGEHVVVGLKENALMAGSLAVYAVPLLMMFFFAIGGQFITSWLDIQYSEGLRIVFALGGLLGGFVWLSRFTRKIQKDPRYQAVVLRKAAPVAPSFPAQVQ